MSPGYGSIEILSLKQSNRLKELSQVVEYFLSLFNSMVCIINTKKRDGEKNPRQ
jgi:hypothetical protein